MNFAIILVHHSGVAPRLERPRMAVLGSFLSPSPFLGAEASYHMNTTFPATEVWAASQAIPAESGLNYL